MATAFGIHRFFQHDETANRSSHNHFLYPFDQSWRQEVDLMLAYDNPANLSFFSTSFPNCPPNETPDEHILEYKKRKAVRAAGTKFEDLIKLPNAVNHLGPLMFSKFHFILLDVYAFNMRGYFVAQEGIVQWSTDVVKMPQNPSNVYYVPKAPNKHVCISRWNVIMDHLRQFASQTIVTVEQFQAAILRYSPKHGQGRWSFETINRFSSMNESTRSSLQKILPKIAALASRLPQELRKGIPLLRKCQTAAITMTQMQIACLLANAFFCTFPNRNTTGDHGEYRDFPSINFTSLFGKWSARKKEKIQAILHYFQVVTSEDFRPSGLVTFNRRSLRVLDLPSWRKTKQKLNHLYVSASSPLDAESAGLLQVNFGSSMVGGGVLGTGTLQEEMIFVLHPELIVSRLFTEKLGDNECLVVTGVQRYNICSGYGDDFKWIGPYVDNVSRDKWLRLQRQIVTIDALSYKKHRDQFNMTSITRELNKAYIGFLGKLHCEEPDIATGKWGCGSQRGDSQLKAIIQLMAAGKARRGLAFFTFHDETLKGELQEIYYQLVRRRVSIGQLYKLLEFYCAHRNRPGGVYTELFHYIRRSISSHRR